MTAPSREAPVLVNQDMQPPVAAGVEALEKLYGQPAYDGLKPELHTDEILIPGRGDAESRARMADGPHGAASPREKLDFYLQALMDPAYTPSVAGFGALREAASLVSYRPSFTHEGDATEQGSYIGPNGETVDPTFARTLHLMAAPATWVQGPGTERHFLVAAGRLEDLGDPAKRDSTMHREFVRKSLQVARHDASMIAGSPEASAMVLPAPHLLVADDYRRLIELSRVSRRQLAMRGVDVDAMVKAKLRATAAVPVRANRANAGTSTAPEVHVQQPEREGHFVGRAEVRTDYAPAVQEGELLVGWFIKHGLRAADVAATLRAQAAGGWGEYTGGTLLPGIMSKGPQASANSELDEAGEAQIRSTESALSKYEQAEAAVLAGGEVPEAADLARQLYGVEFHELEAGGLDDMYVALAGLKVASLKRVAEARQAKYAGIEDAVIAGAAAPTAEELATELYGKEFHEMSDQERDELYKDYAGLYAVQARLAYAAYNRAPKIEQYPGLNRIYARTERQLREFRARMQERGVRVGRKIAAMTLSLMLVTGPAAPAVAAADQNPGGSDAGHSDFMGPRSL